MLHSTRQLGRPAALGRPQSTRTTLALLSARSGGLKPAAGPAAPRSGAAAPCCRGARRAAPARAGPGDPATLDRSNSATFQQELPAGFDLGLAVAMAAAAFEAYLEPLGGSFKEESLNNTHTTYTSRDFLLESFSGVLEITVDGASGLKGVNISLPNSKDSDPYCVVSCSESVGRTGVWWNTTDPEWGMTFRLFVRDIGKDVLRVRVYDKGRVRSDAELGVAMVPASTFAGGQEMKLDLPLQGNNGEGHVRITARFLPFAEAEQSPLHAAVLEAAVADSTPVIPGAPTPEEAAAAAAAAAAAVEKAAAEAGPAVGEAVQQVASKAVEAIEGAATKLEAKLNKVGADGRVIERLDSVKQKALDKARAAADAVSGYVEKKGISSVPAKDLSKILGAIKAAEGTGVDAKAPAPAPEEEGEVALKPEELPGAWKALAEVAGRGLQDVFEKVAYLENVDSDTQVWISRSLAEREVVISFRGTEQVKWKDFVSDANLIPQTLDVERTGNWTLGVGQIPSPFKDFKKNADIMVHSGFLAAWDSVKVKVLTILDQVTATATQERPWKVYITGHSLGGALATLCAYEASTRVPKSGLNTLEMYMYTFGAPRVGNAAFAEAFNSRLPGRSWRITNASDIVPTVPRLMGYSHVRTGVRLELLRSEAKKRKAAADKAAAAGEAVPESLSKPVGAILKFEDQSKDVLGEGRDVTEVISDLASKAIAVTKGEAKLTDVVDAIKDHEMALLAALIDGSALSQHMEDFYLLALREALLTVRPELSEDVKAALEEARAAGVARQSSFQ